MLIKDAIRLPGSKKTLNSNMTSQAYCPGLFSCPCHASTIFSCDEPTNDYFFFCCNFKNSGVITCILFPLNFLSLHSLHTFITHTSIFSLFYRDKVEINTEVVLMLLPWWSVHLKLCSDLVPKRHSCTQKIWSEFIETGTNISTRWM